MTNWHTVPATALQGVHPPCDCRLSTPYVNVPAGLLPNGLPRPERIKIEAAFRLGGDFHFLARVVRHERLGTLLQVERAAFDLVQGRRILLQPGEDLLSEVYAELSSRFLAAQGRRYGRREGRN